MKTSCVPFLEILGLVIVNWDTKKRKKTATFGLKSYYFVYNSKTIWRARLKFVHNVDVYECFIQTEFGGAGHVTKILLAENGQKLDEFEPIYLGN